MYIIHFIILLMPKWEKETNPIQWLSLFSNFLGELVLSIICSVPVSQAKSIIFSNRLENRWCFCFIFLK